MGLKQYINLLYENELIQNPTLTDFCQYILVQIANSTSEPSTFDKLCSIFEKAMKIIEIISKILEWTGLLGIPSGVQMQYNIYSDNLTERLLALEEAFINNYISRNIYTKPEIDAMLQNIDIDTSHFVRNDITQNLINIFHFSNQSNSWVGGSINPQRFELDGQTFVNVVTAGNINNDTIPTRGYVDSLINNIDTNRFVRNDILQNLTNEFHFSNILNSYVAAQFTMGNVVITSIVTAGVVNNDKLTTQGYVDSKINDELDDYYDKNDIDNMLQNYAQINAPQNWNNVINMTNPANSIAAALLTLGGVALGAVVTGGSSNNDKAVTQGYVDNKIASELGNYYTKSEVDTLLSNLPIPTLPNNLGYSANNAYFYIQYKDTSNNNAILNGNCMITYFDVSNQLDKSTISINGLLAFGGLSSGRQSSTYQSITLQKIELDVNDTFYYNSNNFDFGIGLFFISQKSAGVSGIKRYLGDATINSDGSLNLIWKQNFNSTSYTAFDLTDTWYIQFCSNIFVKRT